MKHTARRALALLIALILALPTLALAEEDVSNAPVDGAVQEMAAFDLGDGDEADDGLTFAEDIDGEAPEVTDDSAPEDTDGEEAEAIDGEEAEDIDEAAEVAGFLSAGGFVALEDVPEGAFVVDFVCEPEDAAIAVYPAATDENPFPEAIDAAGENVWFLFPGDYTYTAEAGEASYQEDFTVSDSDITLRVALTDEAPVVALDGAVSFIYYTLDNGALVEHTDGVCDNYTTVTDADSNTDVTWEVGSASEAWYVVSANATIENRITVNGTVNLILVNGKTLTATKGIAVNEGKTLNIYAQSTAEDTMGKLLISGVDENNAGIGSNNGEHSGNITIHGGNVTVTGGKNAAGIGGGNGGIGVNITIHGGTVKATGGAGSYAGAGIGGGDSAPGGGRITINGGTVVAIGVASGRNYSAGIGGGSYAVGGTIIINGGSVTATGGSAAAKGIGAGSDKTNDGTLTLGSGVTLEISGDGTTWSEYTGTRAQYMQATYSAPTYTVTLTGGGNATSSGGDATQTGLTGAMTNVVYTPNTGYHFEASDFANLSSNGVTATYDATTRNVIVSGTPTADVAIVIPDAVEDGAKLMVISASFKDKFQLNYYYNLPASVTADDGAYVRFTKGGKTTDVLVKDITPQDGGDYDGLYRFTFPIVAKEGRDTVNAKLYDGNSTAVTTFNSTGETDLTTSGYDYSLFTYLDYMATNGESDTMKDLAAAAIDYCTAAQIYFGYNADGLSVSGAVDAVSAGDLDDYAPTLAGTLPDGVSLKMMTVMFEADNSFRLYYTGDSLDAYTYKVDGADAALKRRDDGARYITKTGIPARLLHKPHTYSVTDGTNTYTLTASMLTYARAAIVNGSGNIVTLCKAFYLYNQAALNHFGENEA